LALQEFIDTTLKESSTAPVAMAVDDITTDSPQLATFVADQVTKNTEKLRAQVAQLQKQLHPAKNNGRGAKLRSAPHDKKKKKDAPPASRNAQNGRKPNGRQAEPADKGTTGEKRKPGKGRRKKKTTSTNNAGSQSRRR
jgi:hypothetical protein